MIYFTFYIRLILQAHLCTSLVVNNRPATIFAQSNSSNSDLAGKTWDIQSGKHVNKQRNRGRGARKQGRGFGNNGDGVGVCAPLTNVQGTHYTVNVNVGTPPQKFNLIPDTGSGNLIVASCDCWKNGFCQTQNSCFLSNESSTLHMGNDEKGPTTVILTFGSGPIESIIASDLVHIGELGCSMEDGLLLMVDNMLDFASPFEGILGLGFPEYIKPTNLRNMLDSTEIAKKDIRSPRAPKTEKSDYDYIWTPHIFNASDAQNTRFEGKIDYTKGNPCVDEDGHRNIHCEKHPELQRDVNFLQRAGVSRFSICFESGSEDGNDGVLRLNTPEMESTFANIADYHWALNLEGIVAGNVKTPKFCSLENLPPGQRSPCGAIVDSGTTYILGPGEQIRSLYSDMCDQWPRCKRNYTALENAAKAAKSVVGETSDTASWLIKPVDKAMVFMAVLSDCDMWFDSQIGLREIPPISIHLSGGGKNLTLELEAWSFVVSQHVEEFRLFYEDIKDTGKVIVNYTKTGRKKWQCLPAFAQMNYLTEKNGPAWILGLPLFYEYVVNFDTSKEVPALSFSKEPCASCANDDDDYDGSRLKLQKRSTSSARRPRQVHGEPRSPDTNAYSFF